MEEQWGVIFRRQYTKGSCASYESASSCLGRREMMNGAAENWNDFLVKQRPDFCGNICILHFRESHSSPAVTTSTPINDHLALLSDNDKSLMYLVQTYKRFFSAPCWSHNIVKLNISMCLEMNLIFASINLRVELEKLWNLFKFFFSYNYSYMHWFEAG